MRRAIIPIAFIAPFVFAALRLQHDPYFAGMDSYAFLLQVGLSTQHMFAALTALYLVLFGTIYFAQKKWNFPDEIYYVLLATPAFLSVLTTTGPQLLITISVLLALLYFQKNTIVLLATIFAFIISPHAIWLSIIPFIVFIKRKQHVHNLLLIACIYFLYLPSTPQLAFAFTEFGQFTGSSLFVLLLSLAGLLITWKKTNYRYLLSAGYVIVSSFIFADLRMSGAFLAAGLAGIALHKILKRAFVIDAVKGATVLIVAAGLMYSGAAGAVNMLRAPPDADVVNTLAVLETAGAQTVYVLPNHAAYFQWKGYTVDAPAQVQNARRFMDIVDQLPPYVILHEQDDAEQLRFYIEHTTHFRQRYSGVYSVWEVTR